MKKIFTSDKVYVSRSKINDAGRGVFAGYNIKKGDTIEISPIIEIPKNDTSNLTESVLVTYFFYFGKSKNRVAIALGFGSIYNHSYKPNAIYRIKPNKKVIEFIAIKNIKKDEEITFNYKGSNSKQTEITLWFEK